MGRLRGFDRCGRLACVAALGAACLALANCSSGSRIDPKYGVSASARAVEPGEPVPKGGGTYRVGKPYVMSGRTYVPEENVNYVAEGMASWYGDDFHGRFTANGEIFDMNSISAAHPTLPMPSYVRVTNLRNHKSIVVRVNDRGPYANDRVIDLSVRTAKLLDFYGHGLAKVRVEYVGRAPLEGSDDRKLMATLREDDQPGHASPVVVASAQPFIPQVFDKRPMTQLGPQVPAPTSRPYMLGESDEAPPAQAAPRPPTTALAANTRSRPVERAPLQAAAEEGPRTSPVSAFAPVRYDAPAGFMSGRGLY